MDAKCEIYPIALFRIECFEHLRYDQRCRFGWYIWFRILNQTSTQFFFFNYSVMNIIELNTKRI